MRGRGVTMGVETPDGHRLNANFSHAQLNIHGMGFESHDHDPFSTVEWKSEEWDEL